MTWRIYIFFVKKYCLINVPTYICLLFSITRETVKLTILSVIDDPFVFYDLVRNIGIIGTYLSFGLSKGVLQSLNLNSSGEPQRAESFRLIIKQSLFLLILKVDHGIELASDLKLRDYSFDTGHICIHRCTLERFLNRFLSNIF